MRKYKSHKIVEAAKIADIVNPSHNPDASILLEGGESVRPSYQWWERWANSNDNWVGGYYVRYSDGYDSWSPAQAFEEGYTVV